MVRNDQQAEAMIRRSVAAYRCLLNLYPAAFRREYAEPMAQVFRDQCRDAYRQSGAVGIVEPWVEAIPDLVGTAFAEHVRERSVWNMVSSKLLSAGRMWALFVGPLWLIGSVSPWIPVTWLIAILIMPLAVLGIYQLAPPHTAVWRRATLGLSMTGSVLAAVGLLGLSLQSSEADLLLSDPNLWILFAGAGLLAVGLMLLGWATLRQRPLPRGNWLPMGLGIVLAGQMLSMALLVFSWSSPNPSITFILAAYPYYMFALLFGLGWLGIAIAPFYDRKGNLPTAESR